jgi:hypothetical protein
MEGSATSKLNKLLIVVFGVLLLATVGMGVYYQYLNNKPKTSEFGDYAPIRGVDVKEFPAAKNLEKVVQESERSSRGVFAGVKDNKIYLGGGLGYLRPIDLAPDTLYSCQKMNEGTLCPPI